MSSHWAQNDIVINGTKLHYIRTGDGTLPPLVLQHGFSDNGLCWTPTAEALKAEYDIIMPDARGHGLSARVQPGEEVDTTAALAGCHTPTALRECRPLRQMVQRNDGANIGSDCRAQSHRTSHLA